MAYKGMGGVVKAPKQIKTPSGNKEKLIYANDEEIEMLRQAGGSGAMTPFGGIRSYDEEGDSEDNMEDNTEEIRDMINDAQVESYWEEQGGLPSSNNDSDSKPTFSYSTTETREWDGKSPITLQELYDNQGDKLKTYLEGKQTSTTTETRTVPPGYSNSGQTYDVTITTKGDPRADDIDSGSLTFKEDRDGNIIGWITARQQRSLACR